MKIGDRIYVRGYIDEIRKDTIIIRNAGGYFGTIPSEVITGELPSAQPEIIRRTECKHYREYDSKYVENAVVVQCMADRYPISETIPDGWFCAGAERKDDE